MVSFKTTPAKARATLAVAMLAVCCLSESTAENRLPLSVADTVETTRIIPARTKLNDSGGPVAAEVVAVAPNGRRYAALLLRGDTSRNGIWGDLLSGEIGPSVDHVGAKIVARLFSRTRFYPAKRSEVLPGTHLAWLADNERVAFNWDDEAGNTQAVAVNVVTGEVQFLTNHRSDVYKFDVSPTGAILYSARVPADVDAIGKLTREGFVVKNDSVFSLLDGDNSGQGAAYQRFIATEPNGGAPARPIQGGREAELFPPFLDAAFSPDGRHAIVVASPVDVPDSWKHYNDPDLVANVERARRGSGQQGLSQLAQMYIVDLKEFTMRPLLDAPVTNFYGLKAKWSPNSSSVIVGPTRLPAAGYRDAGEMMIEVDINTGDLLPLPNIQLAHNDLVDEILWTSVNTVRIIVRGSAHNFRRTESEWVRIPEEATGRRDFNGRIRVRLKQGMNDPPALVAVDDVSRRERMIFDLNPKLRSDFRLGRVESLEWRDKQNRKWTGRLYLPTEHKKGKRYPMVIQTHGYAPLDEFSLYGMGVGVGPGLSIYAAQALANRNIVVLQMQDPRVPPSPEEADTFVEGMDSAIDHLASTGIVNIKKIGLSGFSRTGWYVLHALITSRFSISAALVSDNLEAGYVVSVLSGDHSIHGEFALDHGAPRVGEGLHIWLKRSPAFNVDRIHTPLRMQRETGGLQSVLGSWELLAGLRDLDKPVELYIIPNIDTGNHGFLMPSQAVASQEGAVDWFEFWLNGRESGVTSKQEQYTRWREMRLLHERDLLRQESLSRTQK